MELAFWSALMASGFVTGAMVAARVYAPPALLAFLLAYTAEVLVTAVGISLVDPEGTLGENFIKGIGLIAGGALGWWLGLLLARMVGSAVDGGPARLAVLGLREVAFHAPAFFAFGVLGYEDGIAIVFLIAVFYGSIVQAVPTTVLLRDHGFGQGEILLHWIAVSVCLVAIAVIGDITFPDSESMTRTATLAVAAGALLTFLSGRAPSTHPTAGLLGLLIALRFGLAFLVLGLANAYP